MIGRLNGAVIDRAADGCCVVDVQGVGYEVFVPARSSMRLPAAPEQVTLHIHTHVREEALTLYAFEDADDRRVFRALLGVNKLGPKLAMSILGDMSAGELAGTVAREDDKRLATISGIGKKTAARLVLELKDKLASMNLPSGGNGVAAAARVSGGPGAEAVDALVGLGFARVAAERAVDKVVEAQAELPMESVLRRALASLA